MAPEITIRRLEPDRDAELYRDIRLEALRLSPEAYGSAFETETPLPLGDFAGRLARNSVLGAFRATLVGMAGLMVEEGPKRRHKGHIWGVYVRPEERGAGIARRLCEAVIAVAEGEVEQLQLTVTSTNLPARRLYQDLGFVEYGIELNARKVDGRYHDDILMVKDLRTP